MPRLPERMGIVMAAWRDHWPLARRWAFWEPRLLQLPQKSHGFQADFCPLPKIVEDEYRFWLGLVVDPDLDWILATSVLDEPPIVQDLAEMLSDAMMCPLSCGRFRPEVVFLRDNPEWDRLFPHLGQVGIETVVTEDLSSWDAKVGELIEWLKEQWSTPSKVVIQTDEEWTADRTLLEFRILGHHFLYCRQPRNK